MRLNVNNLSKINLKNSFAKILSVEIRDLEFISQDIIINMLTKNTFIAVWISINRHGVAMTASDDNQCIINQTMIM